MNPRTTGILFLVAVALGAFLYFYEYRAGKGWREPKDAGELLFPDLDAEAIESISITTSDDRDARLERVEAGWRLVEPVVFPGDAIALDGMASALAELGSESVIEAPQPLEVYGLADAARIVRFRAGERDYELRIGNRTPVGSSTYFAAGDAARVFTVATFRANTFTRSLDDLRERRPLRFDRSTIERIEASWPGGGVVLAKQDGSWHLVEPLEWAADASTVETLLSDLSFLRASGFLDDPPPDAELGLDPPRFRVVLVGAPPEEGGEPQRLELAVGDLLEDDVRAARAAEASLYRIPDQRFEDFPRRVAAYRFKELASFLGEDAQRVELVFPPPAEQEAPVTIVARHDGQGWSAEPERLAEGKLASLVAELARLRASDIEAEAMDDEQRRAVGLEPPRAIFRVYGAPPESGGEATKLAEVHLGDAQPERGILARVPDRETIYRLDFELAEHLPLSLDAFRNRFVATEAPESPEESPEGGEASEPDSVPEAPAER